MELTDANVVTLGGDCLLTDDRLAELMIKHDLVLAGPDGADAEDVQKLIDHGEVVAIKGIVNTICFDPQRLEARRDDVLDLIRQLPTPFDVKQGGGWSFLNLCQREDGQQWTDLHQTQEVLCLLAVGLKLAKWVMPRDMWDIFPGGMPYIMFSFDGSTLETEEA
jgi:hypothetical protein